MIYSTYFKDILIQNLISRFTVGASIIIYSRLAGNNTLLVSLPVGATNGLIRNTDGNCALIAPITATVVFEGIATHAEFLSSEVGHPVLLTIPVGLLNSNALLQLNSTSLRLNSEFTLNQLLISL